MTLEVKRRELGVGMSNELSRALGVDGAGRGWVFADSRTRALGYVEQLPDLASAEVVAIDIPLGFPAIGARRESETAAAKLLARGRSSVFWTLPKRVYEVDTAGMSGRDAYAAARAEALALTGSSISAQAWALRAKILHAQAFLSCAPGAVIEVHPEVAFTTMNQNRPPQHGKKTWLGSQERNRLLRQHGHDPNSYTGDCGPAAVDDVLDAIAVAWVAQRHATGQTRPLGAPAPPDVPIWT